jgi:hypothetical protein
MERSIKVFHTHIEVWPYKLGESPRVEKAMSVWIDAEYRYEPLGYYFYNDTLYVPRGFDINLLEKEFKIHAENMYHADEAKKVTGVKMLCPPRDETQVRAIDYLMGRGRFYSANTASQQALILDTGIGKTYVTIHSIIEMKTRAIIITHQDKIKQQWIERFKEYSNVKDEYLIDIAGSPQMEKVMKGKLSGYYYFINHQTINSYLRNNGPDELKKFFKKISVGIKVFDEAHLSFKNVMRTDFFSNTRKTYYLTANFDRTDPNEARVFRRAFDNAYKMTESQLLKDDADAKTGRKHIVFIPTLYRSNPAPQYVKMAMNSYGFSVAGFFKYAFHYDQYNTMREVFYQIFEMAIKLEGRILITLPKIEDTYILADSIKKHYPDLNRSIGTVNSKNTKDDNEYVKENSDIIVSTIRSCGTGVDIKKLRVIINLEPFSSKITANQLAGRLREYSPTEDTYFFHLVDLAFPVCEDQYLKVVRHLKGKCKSIEIFRP